MDIDLNTIRLVLHLLGATVWVGGQIVLAALVPTLRTLGPDAPREVAQRFGRVAWPFYALLVVTGVWNLLAIDVGGTDVSYQATLGVKLLLVALSGIAAFAHTATESRVVRGITGGGGLVAALGALFCGVLLAH